MDLTLEAEHFRLPATLHPARGVELPESTCPVARLRMKLRKAGLRPTRQRMQLGWLLFAKGHRHISAEDLFHEANKVQAPLALATVYNTLNQFREAGLIRQVNIGGDRAVFDTDTGDHHHFLFEDDGAITDIPPEMVAISSLPEPPPGYRIAGLDLVVRLERIPESGAA
jgi:Fur family iron response transcriptional regulator